MAHPFLKQGGSEAACLRAIEALAAEYDVTLLTTGPVKWAELNARYGTSIPPDTITVRRPWSARFLGHYPGAALTDALHQRFCRRVASRFDVLFSAYNPVDFGQPAIHRIADFGWHAGLRERTDEQTRKARGLLHRNTPLRRVYLALAKALRAPSGRDLFTGEDTLIVNSEWTGRMMAEQFPAARQVMIHPPVDGSFAPVPWPERETGFVCLGRVSHEKRIDVIIGILERVRQRGHQIHLHIIGPSDGTPYGESIDALAREHAGWMTREGAKQGAEKEHLLTGHRYAIHGRRAEPFGIAVAEMVKAGCVPFVPDEGGPPEIVGDKRLCYRDADDAVSKIDAVLRDEALQETLHRNMLERGQRFGVEAYQTAVRDLVRGMLES